MLLPPPPLSHTAECPSLLSDPLTVYISLHVLLRLSSSLAISHHFLLPRQYTVYIQCVYSVYSVYISRTSCITRSTGNIHTFLAPLVPVLFEIQLRDSDRTIFQTILNETNLGSNFINLDFPIRIFCNKALCRYVILVQNCLKSRCITGPKLYLKREKFYSCFKLVTIFSCHPLYCITLHVL
eukprot:sb/3471601/